MEVLRLNASALSDPNSLRVPVTIPTFSDLPRSLALIDSGSSHCFIDTRFAFSLDIIPTTVLPMELKLFDGTSNSIITQVVSLPISFPTSECITIDFFVTPLDTSCSMVLGYNWLTRYNPLIDWVLGSIKFQPNLLDNPAPFPTSSARSATLPTVPTIPSRTFTPTAISLINATAFARACKLPGAQSFRIHL